MVFIVIGLAVLGVVAYSLVTLLPYFGESATLSHKLEEVQSQVNEIQLRLTEYQMLVECLEHNIPEATQSIKT